MMVDGKRLRSLLVVAPHPDDETIGAWQLISTAMRSRVRVTVIVASDGAASHPGSTRWPAARLVQARRMETRRAMRTLGITPLSIHFLNLADGALDDHPSVLRRALSKLIAHYHPALIVGPLSGDAHGDHRAVARALKAVPRSGERRVGYQVWPEDQRRRGRCLVRLDGLAMAQKRRAVRGYRTQTGSITDAVAGFTLTSKHLRAFVRPVERFTVLA
jgi:LmbE family N-acetylglucosaminyl deacetylase